MSRQADNSLQRPNNTSHPLVVQLNTIVEENLQNEQFGVEELARLVGVSRSHLHRKLQETTGQSVSQFIREYRLNKAMRLLKTEKLTASEVAYRVGFGSATYFSKSFAEYFGFPPGEARRREHPTDTTKRHKKRKHSIAITGLAISSGAILVVFFLLRANTPSTPEDITDRSIAMLPLVNMSDDPDQDYFSDGMTEEIVNRLAQIEDLEVASRTTTMQYKDTDKSLQEISRELGVAYLLEGSVRKQGDQVRITAQLIDAHKDRHLWSESYDRKLDDVFAIQSEVAQLVASSLQAQVDPKVKVRIETPLTTSSRAYELYLQARHQSIQNWGSAPPSVKEYLDSAIVLDSSFVAPYVELGFYWLSQAIWDAPQNVDHRESIRKSQYYLNYAVSRDPENSAAYMYLGYNKLFFEQELEEARYLMMKALELNPSTSHKQMVSNTLLPALGEFHLAQTLILEAMEDSPLDPGVWSGKALLECFTGEHDKARETLQRGTHKIKEGNNLNTAARVYYAIGDYQEVVAVTKEYEREHPNSRPARIVGYQAAAYYKLGELVKAEKLLAELKTQAASSTLGSPSFHIAMIYAQMEQNELAFQWLEKAKQDQEVELYWLMVEPPFEPLKGDPRWQHLLNRIGFGNMRTEN